MRHFTRGKLFEPQKYKGARYLKVFERVFGPPSERQRNSSGICAIGSLADLS